MNEMATNQCGHENINSMKTRGNEKIEPLEEDFRLKTGNK